MNNFDLAVIDQSGVSIPFIFDNGRELVVWLAGTDHQETVHGVKIECIADDGRRILIIIPNDDSTSATISITDP